MVAPQVNPSLMLLLYPSSQNIDIPHPALVGLELLCWVEEG